MVKKKNITMTIRKKKNKKKNKKKHLKVSKKSRRSKRRSKKKVITKQVLKKLRSLRKKGREKRLLRVKFRRKKNIQKGSARDHFILFKPAEGSISLGNKTITIPSDKLRLDKLKDIFKTVYNSEYSEYVTFTIDIGRNKIIIPQNNQLLINFITPQFEQIGLSHSFETNLTIYYTIYYDVVASKIEIGHRSDTSELQSENILSEHQIEKINIDKLSALNNEIRVLYTNSDGTYEPYYISTIVNNEMKVTEYVHDFNELINMFDTTIANGDTNMFTDLEKKDEEGLYNRILTGEVSLDEVVISSDYTVTDSMFYLNDWYDNDIRELSTMEGGSRIHKNNIQKGGLNNNYINMLRDSREYATIIPASSKINLECALINILEKMLEIKHDFGAGPRGTFTTKQKNGKDFKQKVDELCGVAMKNRLKKAFSTLNIIKAIKRVRSNDKMFLFDDDLLGEGSSWKYSLDSSKYSKEYKRIVESIRKKAWNEGRIFTDMINELNTINMLDATYDIKYYNVNDFGETWDSTVLQDVKNISIDEKCQRTLFTNEDVYNLLYNNTELDGIPWKRNTLGNALDPGSGTVQSAIIPPLLFPINSYLFRTTTLQYCFWEALDNDSNKIDNTTSIPLPPIKAIGLFYKSPAPADPILCGSYTIGLSVNKIYYILDNLDIWILKLSSLSSSLSSRLNKDDITDAMPSIGADKINGITGDIYDQQNAFEGIFYLFYLIKKDAVGAASRPAQLKKLFTLILLDFKKAGDWSQILSVKELVSYPSSSKKEDKRTYFTGDDKLAVLFAHLSYTPYICRWTDYTSDNHTFLLIVTPLYLIPDNKEIARFNRELEHSNQRLRVVSGTIDDDNILTNDLYTERLRTQIKMLQENANRAAKTFESDKSESNKNIYTTTLLYFRLSVNVLIHYYKYRKELAIYNGDTFSSDRISLSNQITKLEKALDKFADISTSATTGNKFFIFIIQAVPRLLRFLFRNNNFNKLYNLVVKDYNTYIESLEKLNTSISEGLPGSDPLELLSSVADGTTIVAFSIDEEGKKERSVGGEGDRYIASFSGVIHNVKQKIKDAISSGRTNPTRSSRRGTPKTFRLLTALTETLVLPA